MIWTYRYRLLCASCQLLEHPAEQRNSNFTLNPSVISFPRHGATPCFYCVPLFFIFLLVNGCSTIILFFPFIIIHPLFSLGASIPLSANFSKFQYFSRIHHFIFLFFSIYRVRISFVWVLNIQVFFKGYFVTGYPLSNFHFLKKTMSLFLKALPLMAFRTRPCLVFLCRVSNTIPLSLSRTSTRTRTVFSNSASASETLTSNAKPPLALSEPLEWVNRTAFCGELSSNDVGKSVQLCGWVALHRVHGGLTFLNLRDHTGIIQVLACCKCLVFLIQFPYGILLALGYLLSLVHFIKVFVLPMLLS